MSVKGFATNKNKKSHPIHGKKGVDEKSFSITEKGMNDKIEVKIDPIKNHIEEKQKEIRYISREPVVGKIKNKHYQNRAQDVTLDIELKHHEGKKMGIDGKTYENPLELSISGGVWNTIHSDITSGGQIEDELKDALAKHEFTPIYPLNHQDMKELLDVWQKWHLNDMRTGTDKQEKIISEHIDDKKYEHLDKFYDRKIAILKDHDLEVDNGIDFGKAWYYEPLPEDVINFIREIQEKLKVNENGKRKD